MNFFVEGIAAWVIILIVISLVAYAMYVNDRNAKRLGIMLGVAVLTLLGGILLDNYVETDREKINKLLNQISQELRADDLDAVETHIAPDAVYTKNLAAAGMALAKLTVANVGNTQIDWNDATTNPTATVTFTGSFRGTLKGGSLYGHGEFIQRTKFEVVMEKINGTWYVTDEFTFDPPIAGLPQRN